jgi:branched-chain amino acid transport system substrate-binding protein
MKESGTLNDKPVIVSRELVKIYGISLLEDPERLGQLLEDKCSDCRYEIFLLSFALRDVIKGGSLPDAEEFGKNRDQVVSRLSDNLGFSQASAVWAADAISAILSDERRAGNQIEARRGFLSDIEKIDDGIAKRPRTIQLRKKAFRNGLLLLGILVLFLALFVRITGSRMTVADDHRLLFLAHLSGVDAAFGHVRLKGAQLAADQINRQGGVKGRMLRIQAHDIPQNPKEAAEVVDRLLKGRMVTAIISSCGDRVNEALAVVADKNELPLISTESGMVGVTMITRERPWLYSFRTSYDNAYRGKVLAYFLSEGLNRKKSALLFHAEDEQSVEIRDSFAEVNAAYHGEVTYESSLNVRGGLRSDDAQEIISSGAEVIVFACNPDVWVARALQTLRLAGYRGAFLGSGYDEFLRNEAGKNLDNSWWVVPAAPDDPQLLSFHTSYRDMYNERISGSDFAGTVLSYDSVRWMADALYRAPGFQGEALRHALLSTQNLALTHATLTIDPRTHAPWNKAVALIYCADGGEKFQKRFRPR